MKKSRASRHIKRANDITKMAFGPEVDAQSLYNDNFKKRVREHKDAILNNTLDPPIGEWDVSGVTSMDRLFEGWVSYEPVTVDLNAWNVSNVTSMEAMFARSNVNWRIENWNVSNVTNMPHMFSRTTAFNCPIKQWILSNATIMTGLFLLTTSFNQPLYWELPHVEHLGGMFWGQATSTNLFT